MKQYMIGSNNIHVCIVDHRTMEELPSFILNSKPMSKTEIKTDKELIKAAGEIYELLKDPTVLKSTIMCKILDFGLDQWNKGFNTAKKIYQIPL